MADYRIPDSETDSRLDRALKRKFPHLRQVQIEKSLRSGLMRLDGAKVKASHRCMAGQMVTMPDWLMKPQQQDDKQDTKPSVPSAERQKSALSFLDDITIAETKDWIAFNKPAGLAVQGGTSTARHIDGLLQTAYASSTRPKLVHRLDKDTSGILLVAKNDKAARNLAADFQSHKMGKSYLAVILGQLPDAGDIKVPLAKSGSAGREKMAPDYENGQFAHTIFKTLARSGGKLSVMALQPRTGRTHQLRVHMLAAGAPILGDGKYAGSDAHPGPDFAKQLHLHAQFLRLPDGRLLTAPLPDHMRQAIKFLECQADIPSTIPDFDEA
ncbi:MAG: RluA family pseudouridine synthase [Candidatus Puniceispirillaceae bacterium]